MPRNRHKKKPTQSALPAAQASPFAKHVIDRIVEGGPEYLMQNALRVMTDSVQLAGEPEFSDLFMDSDKAAEVTERWIKKYEARLDAAEKKGQDAFQEVFDEMRMHVIDDLATPSFRGEVLSRLQAMINRLLPTADVRKLETALLLQALLHNKEIPWGLNGLVLTIYNQAMDQALETHAEAEEAFHAVLQAIEEEAGELPDMQELIESPEKFEQAGLKALEANPELRERAEKLAMDLVDSFEDSLSEGKVPLNLFTNEELTLPFERLEAELGKPIAEMGQSDEIGRLIVSRIVQTVAEIMTPERYQRLRRDVESTLKTWLRQQNKWTAALQFELTALDPEKYEENPFILHAYLGQMRRMREQQEPSRGSKKRKR